MMNSIKNSWRSIRRSVVPFQVDQQYIALKHYRYYRRLVSEMGASSLEPFARQNCIFVHIPKNGGIAFNKALFDGRMLGGHYAASFYKVVFGKEFEEMFKFAIVRNPWDRVVSAYEFLKGGGMFEGDQKWANKHLVAYPDFNSFVMNWLTKRNIYKGIHFVPQTDFVCDTKGNLMVNYLGRFEAMEESFSEVCQQLGRTEGMLPHKNKSVREKDYRMYYDDASAARVGEVYQQDIEMFGYSFG